MHKGPAGGEREGRGASVAPFAPSLCCPLGARSGTVPSGATFCLLLLVVFEGGFPCMAPAGPSSPCSPGWP